MPITPSGFGAFGKGAMGANTRQPMSAFNKRATGGQYGITGGPYGGQVGYGSQTSNNGSDSQPGYTSYQGRSYATPTRQSRLRPPADDNLVEGAESRGGYLNGRLVPNGYDPWTGGPPPDQPATQGGGNENYDHPNGSLGGNRMFGQQPSSNQSGGQQQQSGQRPSLEGQMSTQRGGAYYDPNGGVNGGNPYGGNGMAFGLQPPDGQGGQQGDQPYDPYGGGQGSPPQRGGQGGQQQSPPYDPYGGGQQGGNQSYAAMGPDGQGLGNGFDMNDYGHDNPPPPSFAPPPDQNGGQQQPDGPFVRGSRPPMGAMNLGGSQGWPRPQDPMSWNGPPGGNYDPKDPNTWRRSDMRLKSNIVRVGTHPLGVGVYDYDIDGHRERGVMAQELLHVLPSAVRVGGDGFMMVNYEVL